MSNINNRNEKEYNLLANQENLLTLNKLSYLTTIKTSPNSIIMSDMTKHSPFYISPTLFHNKHLKAKRCKRTASHRNCSTNIHIKNTNHRRAKTDKLNRHRLAANAAATTQRLQPDVTIDLLSDDETVIGEEQNQSQQQQLAKLITPEVQKQIQQQLTIQPQQQLNNVQHILLYPGNVELSQIPNITLIPVQNLTKMGTFHNSNTKRKRKSHLPKRHAQPTIVNNESIVVSDDENGGDIKDSPVSPNAAATKATCMTLSGNTLNSAGVIAATTTVNHLSTATQQQPMNNVQKATQPSDSQAIAATSTPTITSPLTAHVDEEVTVSLVPRSSTAGSCSKPGGKELFPMLPDETTVHTVIANRIYELSLTKLREGLASCGIAEFADDQQKLSTSRARKTKINPPPVVMPQQAPISLKLSSDLSISLISDDEDDQKQHELISPEKLLQQQPQLQVQHFQVPAVSTATANRQAPRRRKLG